ncbi:hypothetical protein QJQ45_018638 [Haematococcus lacustris]|nr:hypothetical protein QJQ45_018638 [Haematococcus lacustris]
MAELSMKRHKRAQQLVVFFGAASIGTAGGWGADAVLRACRKVVCRPRGTDQLRGRVVLVDEHRTTRVSSAVNGKQPCEVELNTLSATRPADSKPPAGQVEPRLLRPAWSQERGQPVRGMMWCPVVPPRKPPQAPRSSQEATPAAASEPGPSTPQPAQRSKRTKAEPGAAEPTKGKGKGKAAKAKPAPQPGRWLDRDCNAALNMQRIGESRWRPLELCYWPEHGALPAKGKEYPGLGYKRVRQYFTDGYYPTVRAVRAGADLRDRSTMSVTASINNRRLHSMSQSGMSAHIAILLLAGCLAICNGALNRRVILSQGELTTFSLGSAGERGRFLREGSEAEAVYLLGLPQAEEEAVLASLNACGAKLLHPIPTDHWLLRSSGACIVSVCTSYPDLTVAPLPDDFKVSLAMAPLRAASVEAAAAVQQSEQSGLVAEPSFPGAKRSVMAAEHLNVKASWSPSDLALPPSLSYVKTRSEGGVTRVLLLALGAKPTDQTAAASWAASLAVELAAALPHAALLCYPIVKAVGTTGAVEVAVCLPDVDAAVSWLATQPSVIWVEYVTQRKTMNLLASAQMQTGRVALPLPDDGGVRGYHPLWAAGLDGAGQLVGVVDTGLDMGSCYFWDPAFANFSSDPANLYTDLATGTPYFHNNTHRKASGLVGAGQAIGSAAMLQRLRTTGPSRTPKCPFLLLLRVQVPYYFRHQDFNGSRHGTHTSGSIAGSSYGFHPTRQPNQATGEPGPGASQAPAAKLAFLDAGKDGNNTLDLPTDPASLFELLYQTPCFSFPLFFHAGNAGSLPNSQVTGNVMSTALAKNVVAVGATDNYTPLDIGNPGNNLTSANGSQVGTPTFGRVVQHQFLAAALQLTIPTSFMRPHQYVVKAKAVNQSGAIQAEAVVALVPWFFPRLKWSSVQNMTLEAGSTALPVMACSLPCGGLLPPAIDLCTCGLVAGLQLVLANPLNACTPLVGNYTGKVVLAMFNASCGSNTIGSNFLAAGASAGKHTKHPFHLLVLLCVHHLHHCHMRTGISFNGMDFDYIVLGGAQLVNNSIPLTTMSGLHGSQLMPMFANGWNVTLTSYQDPYSNALWFSAHGATLSSNASVALTQDVRIKPEVMAPGALLSAYSDKGYTGRMDRCETLVLAGTSMASASVTGAATLVRQYFTDGYYPTGARVRSNAFNPSASLLRAMLVAGTTNMSSFTSSGLTPYDVRHGFGLVDIGRSLPLRGGPSTWKLQVVDRAVFTRSGQSHTYSVRATGRSALIITLAYMDWPAFPGVSPILVNNLDLRVVAPNGAVMWGNDVRGGDRRNNIEKLVIPRPRAGVYTVRVSATYLFIAARPQPYSLVLRHQQAHTGACGPRAGAGRCQHNEYITWSSPPLMQRIFRRCWACPGMPMQTNCNSQPSQASISFAERRHNVHTGASSRRIRHPAAAKH